MSKNMYSILEEHRHLEEELFESGGVITPEIEQTLAFNELDFKNKMESYAGLIVEHEGKIELIDQQIKRLLGLQLQSQDLINTLNFRMLQALQQYGSQDKSGVWRCDTPLFKFATRKSSSLEITNPDLVPSEFWVTEQPPMPEPKIVKKLITDKIKETGQSVEGTNIVTKYSLKIT